MPHDIIFDLVDLDRYPIHKINTPEGAEFINACTSHMEDHGWCNLDDFIRPDALKTLNAEANSLLPSAETLTIKRTIYQVKAAKDAPANDPRNTEYTHHALQLANDQIPQPTAIQQLYNSEILTDFIRQVQGKQQLYPYADEFQALNIVALPPGSWHGWHYDNNECTVTLLLQAAEEGGDFTFIPNSRRLEDSGSDVVRRFLGGEHALGQSFARGAGTLTLFRGGKSLHGVTEIKGNHPRITAIFTYEDHPGAVAGDENNILIYGDRVRAILESRAQPT